MRLWEERPGYRPCPLYPDNSVKENCAEDKMTHKKRLCFMVAGAFCFVLFVVFLGLYVSERFSNPEAKLRECEDMLANQTSQAQEQVRSLRESMEAVQRDGEKAKREKDQLNVHLVAINKSLAETKDGWNLCLNQLDSLKGNLTSHAADIEQEREKHKVTEEKVEQLQKELQKKSEELDNVRGELQQEREKHRAEIQKLNAERKAQEPHHSNGKASDGPSAILSITLLLAVPTLLASLQQ